MAIIEPKFKQQRNEPCGCGSGLKFKYCHGDSGKRAVVERYVQEIMLRLIMKEKHKQGLISSVQYQAWISKAKGNRVPEPVGELDVGEIMDKAKLKRCAGALCGTPVPDTEEFCLKCKPKFMKGNKK